MERIVVASCDRKPAYVHKCLQTLLADSEVARVSVVVCGASDPGYLRDWSDDERVEIVAPTSAEREASAAGDHEQKVVLTTSRCLRHGLGEDATVLFEDDAIVGKDWLGRAREAAALLQRDHGERFLLSLYSPYSLPKDMRVVPYHPSNYYGNVGLWLPPWAAKSLHECMVGPPPDAQHANSDMRVKGWLRRTGTAAFAISPSVANHVGDQSTKGYARNVRAPSYLG